MTFSNPYNTLLGAVIGLARATEGNEDLITESTHRALLTALTLPPDAPETTISEIRTLVREEKRKLVPNCFDCAMPCGRTDDFDLQMLLKEEAHIYSAKLELLQTLRTLSQTMDIPASILPHFYQSLCFIGYDYVTAEQIQRLKETVLRKNDGL